MQPRNWFAAVAVGVAFAVASPAFAQDKLTVWWVQGLLQGRGRRAVRGDQEVRGQEQERQGRAVAVPGAGHDPEDGGRARFRQPARRRLCRRLRLPGHRQVGLRRQARGRHAASSIRCAPRSSRPRCRPRSSTTTRPRRARTTRSRSSSRRCTSSTGRTCWPRPASRRATSRRPGRSTGASGATRCSRRIARRPASARFGIGQPMGVDSSDSFYSFLTFMDAYNVKLVNDDGKLLVDDPAVRQGLINALTDYTAPSTEGLHAAVVDELEGSGQQRRLPQQDDRHDAQRDDLDRRQVARRLEQRHAHRGAARARRRRTTPS